MDKQKPAWLSRLVAEIERQRANGNSYRQIAMAAGLGVNFVAQLTGDNWRHPSFDNVVRLCEALNISVTYLVTGAEMSHAEEQVLRRLSLYDEGTKETFVEFLRRLPSGGVPPQ